jgi:hypothetical protein
MARVVFVGPDYDPLTRRMRRWLEEMERAVRVDGAIRSLYNGSASAERVRKEIGGGRNGGLLLIFYGHGEPEAFLTEQSLGFEPYVNDGTRKHARLCTASDFPDDAPNDLVGFCCHSALGLGLALRQRNAGHRFLGFRDELPFPSDLPAACESAFTEPMRRALAPVIQSGRLDPDAPRRLYDAYYEQQRVWSHDPPSGVSRGKAMLVSMCIEELLDILELEI